MASSEIVVEQAEGDDGKTAAPVPAVSKKKAKKLAKLERKKAYKLENRLKERERKKERRRLLRESEGPDAVVGRKRLKLNTMATSNCQLRVAIDCSFDNLMAEKDICDLGGQLARCYSINRRLTNPLQYYIVLANGLASAETKKRLAILNCTGHWDVNLVTNDGQQNNDKTSSTSSSAILFGFKREEVVYLTSESPNVLETLDDSKVYVIGGLVDHNTQKGLTLRLANEMGIAHAQLPIGQYVKMLYRKVLTVCHVFEILVKFAEYKDWQKAFLETIPKRHNAEPVAAAAEVVATTSDATAACKGEASSLSSSSANKE